MKLALALIAAVVVVGAVAVVFGTRGRRVEAPAAAVAPARPSVVIADAGHVLPTAVAATRPALTPPPPAAAPVEEDRSHLDRLVAAAARLRDRAPNEPDAGAEADIGRARATFEQGLQLFHAKKYADAAEAFLQAYDDDPDEKFLFNAAVAFANVQLCDDARTLFERYLVEATRLPPDQDKITAIIDRDLDRCAHPPADAGAP